MCSWVGKSAGRYMRELMQSSCVCIPGAFNGLVARMTADKGFKACYLSGGALSASFGVPDIGVLTLDTFTNTIKSITQTSGLPVFADADTGFGEVEMLTKTVYEYIKAGAAGLHIEDQVFPKKCGHLEGKEVVDLDMFCQKIRFAIKIRDQISSNQDFIICARTDAHAVEGFESAVHRAKMYVKAGADMIFPEGLTSEEEFRSFAREMKASEGQAPDGGPFLVANMTEFGKTPPISTKTFSKMGYHAVIFPVSTLRIATKAVDEFLTVLHKTGEVDEELQKKMFTRKELYSTLHYDTSQEWIYPSPSTQFHNGQ